MDRELLNRALRVPRQTREHMKEASHTGRRLGRNEVGAYSLCSGSETDEIDQTRTATAQMNIRLKSRDKRPCTMQALRRVTIGGWTLEARIYA